MKDPAQYDDDTQARRNAPHPVAKAALTTVAATLLLAGCAQPWTAFRPGDDATALTARLGTPAETYNLPDGSKRLMWPTQPLGTTTIAADVSPAGRIESVQQVLQPAEFNQAQVGTWTKNDVLAIPGQNVVAGNFNALVEALESNTAYANIHTTSSPPAGGTDTAFPAGEIRGQIHKGDLDDEHEKHDDHHEHR